MVPFDFGKTKFAYLEYLFDGVINVSEIRFRIRHAVEPLSG